MAKYIGVLAGYFETGTEGQIWVLLEDGKEGYDAMKLIELGDHLRIYGEDNKILFDGKIIPDFEIGRTPYPLNPKYGQPSALGFWIHWTQKGFTADDWARFFLREEFGLPPLRAELTKTGGR
ncbi:MAG: hypothetical protein Q8P76_00425 [bacterium]|nr:hypothetical protein [bacterium]